jgi:hypothetical protein
MADPINPSLAITRFKSICRAYDDVSVKTLGSWASSEHVDIAVRMEAMKLLFMYGHAKPKKKEKKEHSGTINLVMRQIHEGKPPGEK